MKKAYVKPQIYFDSFELSQHIAVCGTELKEPIVMGPDKYFAGDLDCDQTPTNDDFWCYHVPTPESKLFGS